MLFLRNCLVLLLLHASSSYAGYLGPNGCLGTVVSGASTNTVCAMDDGNAYIRGITDDAPIGEWQESTNTTATTFPNTSSWHQVSVLALSAGTWVCQGSTYFEAGTLAGFSGVQFALTTSAAGNYAPTAVDEMKDSLRISSSSGIGSISRDQTPMKRIASASASTVRLLGKLTALNIGGTKYAGGIRCFRIK